MNIVKIFRLDKHGVIVDDVMDDCLLQRKRLEISFRISVIICQYFMS